MRSLYRYGMKPPRFGFTGYDRVVECPESGGEVEFSKCLGCDNHGVWRKDDAARCLHEYRELKSQGFYASSQAGWMQHLHNACPETYERLVREEENNRRVREAWEVELSAQSGEIPWYEEDDEQVNVEETVEPEDKEGMPEGKDSDGDFDEQDEGDVEESDEEMEDSEEGG